MINYGVTRLFFTFFIFKEYFYCFFTRFFS